MHKIISRDFGRQELDKSCAGIFPLGRMFENLTFSFFKKTVDLLHCRANNWKQELLKKNSPCGKGTSIFLIGNTDCFLKERFFSVILNDCYYEISSHLGRFSDIASHLGRFSDIASNGKVLLKGVLPQKFR